jgi:class 3 adenylate cyclase/tetratricopeptide (TPR) repeat protein
MGSGGSPVFDGSARMATLSSYVPQAVLRRIAALPTLPDEPLIDESPTALLFVDISGFTTLTEAAVRHGPAGTERLSRALNSYLGQIIDLIAEHGGDISKIVGDALLAVWPVVDDDLAAATRRAALCGLAIIAKLGQLELETDLRLSLKAGLCAGTAAATHVGGEAGRWLFLVVGEGVAQLSQLGPQMRTGTLVASPAAWAQISRDFGGHGLDDGHFRVDGPRTEVAIHEAGTSVVLAPDRERSLRSYVPEVLVSRLDAGQGDWLAELRRTTVVFVNVRGLSHAVTDALESLQRVTIAAQRGLERYHGWLKEITMDEKGTTLVAAFGVPPFSHEDDPTRAVQAALTLQAAIRALGLSAGVGIATGPALSGPVGNARRRDFAVLGAHVNRAARLMQASGENDALCDAETHDRVSGLGAWERLAAYVLKGLPGPVDVYRVRVAATELSPGATLIDRSAQRVAGVAAIAALKRGQGALVVLEGEPGIGKSSIGADWLARAREAGVTTLVGAAKEIDASTPYHAWRTVFERLLGLEGVVARRPRRERTLSRLRRDKASLRLAPLLEPLLALDLPDNSVTSQLSGEVRADNTNDLLLGLLNEEASTGPTMVVIEDAHWLDSSSWSLLLRARREIPAMLLVVTMRPMGDAESDRLATIRPEITTLRIGALEPGDALALACQRSGATRIADPIAAIVQERAEGNPLFIEQLTYALRDAGRIVVEDGIVQAAGGERLDSSIIPETVQHVITSRIGELPPGESMTLKVASVIGPRFSVRTLAEIYPLPAEAGELVSHLDTLARLDLLAPVPSAAESTYEFRHLITQEVTYNLMLPTQSQTLHRRLAEWYERTDGADLSPLHAVLAHHWRKAGEAARAVDHLELAAAQAVRTHANEEARDFLEQALDLDAEAGLHTPPARRARWLLQLGEAQVAMSRYRPGREHLEAGLRLMNQSAPATPLRQAVGLLAELVRQIRRRTRLASGPRTLNEVERADLTAACRAYLSLAEVSYFNRETLLPLYCVIRNLNEAEASGISTEIARGLAGTGALFGVAPLPRVAEWYLNRSLRELGNVQDLATHEIVNIIVGFYYTGAAKWERAREHFMTVRRMAEKLGDRRRLADAVGNLMEIEFLQGAFDDAEKLARYLAATARARNDRRYEAEGLVDQIYCDWQLGRSEQAQEALAALRQILADETDITDELKIKYRGLLATIDLDRGEHDQALAASEEILRLTKGQRPTSFGTFLGYVAPAEVYLSLWERDLAPTDVRARTAEAMNRIGQYAGVFPVGRPRARTLEGRHEWLLGRRDAAFRSWRRALASAQDLSMIYEEGLAHYEIGRHLDPDDGSRVGHFDEARSIFSRLHASRALAALELAAVVGALTA